jgi:hypothetical protein
MFLSSITDNNLTDLTMGNTTCVYKKQELLTLGEHLGSLPLLAESVLLSFCSFLCCAMFFFVFVLFVFILCLGSNVACISGLFILDSLSWVQCCLYLWVVYTWFFVLGPMLPVSLGCLYLIGCSFFSNVYFQLYWTHASFYGHFFSYTFRQNQ